MLFFLTFYINVGKYFEKKIYVLSLHAVLRAKGSNVLGNIFQSIDVCYLTVFQLLYVQKKINSFTYLNSLPMPNILTAVPSKVLTFSNRFKHHAGQNFLYINILFTKKNQRLYKRQNI